MEEKLNPYEDLPESAPKRVKLDEIEAKSPSELLTSSCFSHSETEIPQNQPLRKDSVSPISAIIQIQKHLTNKKKIPKAVSLLIKLMHSLPDTDTETGATLFDALSNLFSLEFLSNLQIAPPGDSASVRDLMQTYYSKYFDLMDENQKFRLDTWKIFTSLRYSLLTDDSFEFAGVLKEFRKFLEMLSPSDISTHHMFQPSSKVERMEGLLACLETAAEQFRWTWARPGLDKLFLLAAEKRMCFENVSIEAHGEGEKEGDGEEVGEGAEERDRVLSGQVIGQRERLDRLVTSITLKQRQNSSWAGPQTIRTYDSIAHPLRQKNIGLFR